MLTRCPNPRCAYEFDVPAEREGKNGPCPQCGQVITFRSLAVIREVERQHLLRRSQQKPAPENLAAFRYSAVLEDVRSLWNVGSIFRSADGAGFQALFLCGITGCPPNKALAKTSLGAEDVLHWEHHAHALDILPKLAENGVQLVALEKTAGSVPLNEALAQKLLRPPLTVIVGNEVAGISAEVLAAAEVVCHLPMRGMKTSLNVAVAFGVASYQIREGT